MKHYPIASVPAKCTIQQLVKKWHSTCSVSNAQKPRSPSFHIPEVVTDASDHMERSPHKLVQLLSQQTGVSLRSCQRILHDLWLKPYHVTVTVQEAGTMVTWHRETCGLLWMALEHGCSRTCGPISLFFQLMKPGYICQDMSTHRINYIGLQKVHMFQHRPLHNLKICVWCAVWGSRIIGPTFFKETIDTNV
jgi:hypothetical protein